MTSIRRSLACLWLLLCAATLCATAQDDKKKSVNQTGPDLSGTWVLDRVKSKIDEREFRKNGSITLIVSHHEPEIKVTRKLTLNGRQQTQELVYYSDGRGELNPEFNRNYLTGKDVVRTTTKWEKGKLIVKAIYRRKSPEGIFEMETFEKWEVSSDGTTLTKTSWIGVPRVSGQNAWGRYPRLTGPQRMILVPVAPSTVKMVFTRVP